MDKKRKYPSDKEAALRQLGVASKKTLARLAQHVDFVQVSAGRRLVERGAYAPTVMVAVSGALTITAPNGVATRVEAPAVIDRWAADERRVATVGVTANEQTSLVLVDWTVRDLFADSLVGFGDLSSTTEQVVADAASQPAVDIRGREVGVEAQAFASAG